MSKQITEGTRVRALPNAYPASDVPVGVEGVVTHVFPDDTPYPFYVYWDRGAEFDTLMRADEIEVVE